MLMRQRQQALLDHRGRDVITRENPFRYWLHKVQRSLAERQIRFLRRTQ